MTAVAAALLAFAALAAPLPAQEAGGGSQPVAARVIPRGRVLTAEDLAERPVVAGERAPARRPGIGWVARRLIGAGEPLREPGVSPPTALLAGDTVRALREAGGVRVALRATALQDAAIGQRVAVRVDVRRRYEGTLVEPRLVLLP